MKRRLTLHFPREAVHQPITYRLAVDFDIAAKILRAQISPNQSGTMVVELSGDIPAQPVLPVLPGKAVLPALPALPVPAAPALVPPAPTALVP